MTAKTYTIKKTRRSSYTGEKESTTYTGTIEELVDIFSYTLETGQSYEGEKGRRKINVRPTTIKSLVSNLNAASSNAAWNGVASATYSMVA